MRNVEEVLAWLVENVDRNPSAEVVIAQATRSQRYRVKIWRDGTIAFRPIQ